MKQTNQDLENKIIKILEDPKASLSRKTLEILKLCPQYISIFKIDCMDNGHVEELLLFCPSLRDYFKKYKKTQNTK